MERRLTMASTPIIRYYDHLRLVYEVQTRMRELRRTTEGEGENNQRKQQRRDARRVEIRTPEHKDGGSRSGSLRSSRATRSLEPAAGPAGEPAAEPSTILIFGSFPDVSAPVRALRRLPKRSTGKEHSMDCVNHSGVPATAYCQNCGKPLCADCVAAGARLGPRGQILCDSCMTAWQSYQQPFGASCRQRTQPHGAAVLGLIPGVGAMYNGQFFKGFIHVVVFAVLISITDHYDIFGIFIGAWILYQSFEAFHTARALRDGQPPPDPLRAERSGQLAEPGRAGMRPPGSPAQSRGVSPGSYTPGPAGPGAISRSGISGSAALSVSLPGWVPGSACTPPAARLCRSRPCPARAAGDSLAAQGAGRRHRADRPGTVVSAGQLDIFHGRLMEFAWPLLLIALGVWLIVRRLGDSQGGSK
jgi:hypothetical protein